MKQNYIGVKCPECKDGDLAEKKARRGNFFYGCSNYPKCRVHLGVQACAEPCPECGSPYLLEKNLKSGTFLVCPNNKRTESDEPKTGSAAERRKPGMKARLNVTTRGKSSPMALHNRQRCQSNPPGHDAGHFCERR